MTTEENLNLDFLEPKNVKFTLTKNGFLSLTLNGENIGRVNLVRDYPFLYESEFISVCDLEGSEIGIIKNLNDLDNDSRLNAQNHLKARYYCPLIESVKSVKEKMGYFYFKVIIDSKEKSFAVRDVTKSLRFTQNNHLIIFDMDGNRYEIPDFNKIERKSRRLLEPYLY